MRDDRNLPYSGIIGKTSPVQKAVATLRELAKNSPPTVAKTQLSKENAALILTHLLGILDAAGLTNMRGYHSAALSLLRTAEDALDCFIAVGLSHDATQLWVDGKLRGSDAAKIWTDLVSDKEEIFQGSYRKMLRQGLNNYSHCTPEQANWNIYLLREDDSNRCKMMLNTEPMVITRNALQIDRWLCVDMLELLSGVKLVYRNNLDKQQFVLERIDLLQQKIEGIVQEYLDDANISYLDLSCPPEIKNIMKYKQDK